MPYPSLSRTLRVIGRDRARARRKQAERASVYRRLADEIAACRVERRAAARRGRRRRRAAARRAGALGGRCDASARCSAIPADPDARPRARGLGGDHRARPRPVHRRRGARAADAFDGIEAAKQLGRLAKRVASSCAARRSRPPAVVAVWPPNARCGLALYRPIDLDKLAESNYLELRFSRELHWTALLTAVDLIKHHARMLWRLVESQLTAAPLEARYQLMRRLAGDRALTGRHADQLRALSAPDALFLTIDPADDDPCCAARRRIRRSTRGRSASRTIPIVSYCVQAVLARPIGDGRRAAQPGHPRAAGARARRRSTTIGSDVDAQPVRTLQRLARCGSLLGDDILYGISDQLAELTPTGRPRRAPGAADAAGADAVSVGAAARSAWLARRAVRDWPPGDRRRGRAPRWSSTPARVRFGCSSSRRR